jgi:hypothetical protein
MFNLSHRYRNILDQVEATLTPEEAQRQLEIGYDIRRRAAEQVARDEEQPR